MRGDEPIEAHEIEAIIAVEQANEATQQRIVQGQAQVSCVYPWIGWLVLCHGVDERVACLGVLHEESADARGQRAKIPGGIQQNSNHNQSKACEDTHHDAEFDEFHGAHLLLVAHEIGKGQYLIANEDQERPHLLQGPQGLHAHHRDLNRAQRADEEEDGVGLVHATVEAAKKYQHESMDANHVEDKNVAAPSCDHVNVGEASEDADGPIFWSTDGQEP
mmetsp:Transcript_71701/g.171254  ORF Transcript_71701/g.171254 Transcript_71701/m.171254 type:complete len:219 (-) Transcript_71701:725-1381(-)